MKNFLNMGGARVIIYTHAFLMFVGEIEKKGMKK